MAQTHPYSLVNPGSPRAECPCGCWGQRRRAGRTGSSRYLLSAGMAFPGSWPAPTSLALSRLSTERSSIATRASLQDGSAIALINNSSCLPCLQRGEAVKNQQFAPCTLLTKKWRGCDKPRPRAHTAHSHAPLPDTPWAQMRPKNRLTPT